MLRFSDASLPNFWACFFYTQKIFKPKSTFRINVIKQFKKKFFLHLVSLSNSYT